MLVLIEGPDCAGKTTLAENLARTLPSRDRPPLRLHSGPLKTDPLVAYELLLDRYWPGRGQHVIADRWHWGELVYGPLLREHSRLDVARWLHIDMFLAAVGAVVVSLSASVATLKARHAERGDDLIDADMLAGVAGVYRQIERWQTPLCVLPNPEPSTVPAVAGRLEDDARKIRELATYIGSPHPSVLLFGDTRGPRNLNSHRSAFVPYGGTSGHYLLAAIQWAWVVPTGILNACEEDVNRACRILEPDFVVALGRNAQRILTKHDIPHGAVPHPQYVRRFHHKRAQEYGALIYRAAIHRKDYATWPK